MSKKRLKSAAAVDVPADRAAADAAILRLGMAQRERERIQSEMNDKLAAVKKQYEDKALPYQQEIETLAQGVQIFCEAHRDDLTKNGKVKFHRFASGEVNWRIRPPKVSVRGIAAVIERLKTLELDRFLRVKEEVNKEAMLSEADIAASVDGVTIGSGGEDFVITPTETELDEIAA